MQDLLIVSIVAFLGYQEIELQPPSQGEDIVFKKTLEDSRNSVVLPLGYKVVSSNVAGQLIPMPDGRLKISFVNFHDSPVEVEIHARKTTAVLTSTLNVSNRAAAETETVYDLMAPDLHTYNIVHHFTERNITNRSPLDILMTEPIENMQVTDLRDGKRLLTNKQGFVVYALLENPVLNEKQSARIRVTGKVQDLSYRIEQNELVWDRSFSGVSNTLILPSGWELTAVTAPATLATQTDGRIRINILNPREGEVRVAIRARKGAQ